MKKIILLLSILQYTFTFAQKELNFKIHYNPETNYYQTVQQTSEMSMKYITSEEILQKLKEKGVQNPTITSSNSKIEMVLKTGKLSNAKNFPITMEFINTTSNDGKKSIPDGTLIYGVGTIDDLPRLDSIDSKNLDENYKKTLLQTLQSTFSQLSFPEKKMKIGDSFSQKTPLTMPIADVSIKMLITTTYKLLSITNNKANLDVDLIFTLDSNITKYNIKATGQGKGIIVYDLNTQFISKYETETLMEMFLKADKFDLELNAKSGFIQTVAASKT